MSAFARLAQQGIGTATEDDVKRLISVPGKVPSEAMKRQRLADRQDEAKANSDDLLGKLFRNLTNYFNSDSGNAAYNTKLNNSYNTLQNWMNANTIGITPGGLLLDATGISLGKLRKDKPKTPENRVWHFNAAMINKIAGLLKAIRRYTNALHATALTPEQLLARANSKAAGKARYIKRKVGVSNYIAKTSALIAGAPQKVVDRFKEIGNKRARFMNTLGGDVIERIPNPKIMSGISISKTIPLRGFKGFKKGVEKDFSVADTAETIELE